MTKKQALSQSLSRDDKSDWLLPDFVNLEVVDDKDFDDIPILVKDLSEIQARVALGISISYIKKQDKLLSKIKDSIVQL